MEPEPATVIEEAEQAIKNNNSYKKNIPVGKTKTKCLISRNNKITIIMKTKVLLIGLALAAFATTSFAQNANQNAKTTQKTVTIKESKADETKRACFIDKDGNGLCDNFEKGTCTIGNGKGLMDGSGNRQGLRDGSGVGNRNGKGNVDGLRQGRRNGNKGHGPKDGTGNRSSRRGSTGKRPLDGTGYGAQK